MTQDLIVQKQRLSATHDADTRSCCNNGRAGFTAACAALGVHPDGHPLSGIRYVDGHRSVDAPFRCGDGLGVRRIELDEASGDEGEATEPQRREEEERQSLGRQLVIRSCQLLRPAAKQILSQVELPCDDTSGDLA